MFGKIFGKMSENPSILEGMIDNLESSMGTVLPLNGTAQFLSDLVEEIMPNNMLKGLLTKQLVLVANSKQDVTEETLEFIRNKLNNRYLELKFPKDDVEESNIESDVDAIPLDVIPDEV